MSTDARKAGIFAVAAVVVGILSIAAHYWLFVQDPPLGASAPVHGTRI